MIVAIDGPAGAGKSTIARLLAQRLGFLYVDTGAMYRAFTLKALRGGADFSDEAGLAALARQTGIELRDEAGTPRVLLDAEDVTELIRAPDLTNTVFKVARLPLIRQIMVEWQRAFGADARRSIVMEGRDIGTVVFPGAQRKIYLDASVAERAERRVRQLSQTGIAADPAQISADIRARDERDYSRAVGPLRQAADALYLDTSHLSIDEVLQTLITYVHTENK